MAKKLTDYNPRRGLLGILFRAPVYLYRFNLGWLLGSRFVLLIHTGRKSGLERRTVLEVVRYDAERDAYTIASGWGTRADWYRNIVKTPQVGIQVGRRRTAATALVLSPAEAVEEIGRYAQAHPLAFRVLFNRLMGQKETGRAEDLQQFTREIPLIRLTPTGA